MESSNSKSNYEERLIYPLSNQNTPSSYITPQNGIYGFENDIFSPKIVSKDSNTFLLNSHPLSCKDKGMFTFILIFGFLLTIAVFIPILLSILNHKEIEYYEILSAAIGFLMSLILIVIGLAFLTYKSILKFGDKSITITRSRFFCYKNARVYNFGELKRAEIIFKSFYSYGDNISNTYIYLVLKTGETEPIFDLDGLNYSKSFEDFVDLINDYIDNNMN